MCPHTQTGFTEYKGATLHFFFSPPPPDRHTLSSKVAGKAHTDQKCKGDTLVVRIMQINTLSETPKARR